MTSDSEINPSYGKAEEKCRKRARGRHSAAATSCPRAVTGGQGAFSPQSTPPADLHQGGSQVRVHLVKRIREPRVRALDFRSCFITVHGVHVALDSVRYFVGAPLGTSCESVCPDRPFPIHSLKNGWANEGADRNVEDRASAGPSLRCPLDASP